MANIKLLQEAIQAFANGDNEVADKKMRKYFVEQAQEINKKLEEEMDSEEEEMCEDVDTDPEEDMTDDVGYKLNEGGFEFDDGRGPEDWEPDEQMNEADADVFVSGEDGGSADFDMEDGEGSVEVSGEAPDADQWESIKSAFEDLERMFDEIEGGGADFEDDESDDFQDGEEANDDEFADVQFGDEKVGEAFQMKKVSEPEKN